MKLSKLSILYRGFRTFKRFAFLALFGGIQPILRQGQNQVTSISNSIFLIAALAFVIFLASFIWEYLVWRNYTFSIEEGGIKISHGVVRKKDRDIPLGRVQNIDIRRNIFHRILGIAEVDFETAGGKKTEAGLKYLEKNKAEEIKTQIKRQKADEEVTKARERKEEKPIYEINPKELFLLSVFSVDYRAVSFVFVGGGFLANFFGNLLPSPQLGEWSTLVIFSLIFALTILAWLAGGISNFLKYYRFKLYGGENSLEYERGLLNRASGNIPIEKIQFLSIEENPLKRFFDYSTLKIETAGYAGKKRQKIGAEAAIPLAKREKVLEFAHSFLDFEAIKLNEIPKRSRLRYMIRYIILVIGSLILGFVISKFLYQFNYWLLLIPLFLTPLAAHLKWKNKGYQLDEKCFLSMNGFWNRKTIIAPYFRIQNLIRNQTILQKRWDLATIILDTAGQPKLSNNPHAGDIDSPNSKEMINEVQDRFRNSLIRAN